MNTKLSIMAFICLFTNAASANTGSLSAGYASDYFREGAMIAGESVRAEIDYSISVGDSLEELNTLSWSLETPP